METRGAFAILMAMSRDQESCARQEGKHCTCMEQSGCERVNAEVQFYRTGKVPSGSRVFDSAQPDLAWDEEDSVGLSSFLTTNVYSGNSV